MSTGRGKNERRLHAEANALPQVRFGSSAENVAIPVAAESLGERKYKNAKQKVYLSDENITLTIFQSDFCTANNTT